MRVRYIQLWELLIDKKMMRVELRAKAHISSSTLAIMDRDRKVSITVLMKICTVLDCHVGDIMDILPDVDNKYAKKL